MKKEVRDAAKKLKNALRGEITLVNVTKYAESIGYDVIFFNSANNEYLITYNLFDVAQTTPSFTYSDLAHIIFVDERLPYSNKLHRLLHEIGHIVLGHIGVGTSHLLNKDETEAEAEAFVYDILYAKHKYNVFLAVVILSIFLSFGILIGYNIRSGNDAASNVPAVLNNTDIVYVTAYGTKYHRADCIYTKDKNCNTLKRTEAEKLYTPCSVCKP